MFYEPLWEYQQYQLVKRPDTPNIYITWCKPGSSEYQRKSTRTSDLAKAQEILIKYVRDRDRPTRTEPHEVSILDCLVDYVERKIATKSHWTAERTALKHWMAFTKREDLVVVSDLTLKMQEHFIEWRRASLMKKNGRASNATINRDLDVIRAALRDAWKQARLTHPPFVTSLPNPRPRERTLSPKEHAALIDACVEPHLHLFVMLATHTLQRPGAILELRSEQVNLEKGIIDFHKPSESETNKRRAVVPISATLRPHIERAISNSQSGYVIERNGERVKEVKRSFRTACRHADLVDVTPYVLRRTGATLLAASGVPLRQIAGMLGHSTTHTTEYHYAKHQPQYLAEAVGTLDRVLGIGNANSDGLEQGAQLTPNPACCSTQALKSVET